jgi:hypothetical protein
MKSFECPRCGEEAGKRMLRCDSRRVGSCPYKSTVTRIPCSAEDLSSLLLMFGISIFLIWIYPNSFGVGSFFLATLNLGILGVLVLIFCLVSIALLTVLFGRQSIIVSRERGQLWQSRSVKDYEYYLKIISEIRVVAIGDLTAIRNPSVAYLSESDQQLFRTYISSKKVDKSQEGDVIVILRDVIQVLIFRLVALGQVTLKQGRIYNSYWKKVDEHSDAKAYFIFRNANAPAIVGSALSVVEKNILSKLNDWNSPEQENSNFVAPDLKELVDLFADSPTIAALSESVLAWQKLDGPAGSAISRAEAIGLIQALEPRLALELHQELQAIFHLARSSARMWISRLGLRLQRKQVRVALVAGSLIIFFLLRFTAPVRHATQISEVVKNLDLQEEGPGVVDAVGKQVKKFGDQLVENKTLSGVLSDLQDESQKLLGGSQKIIVDEYDHSRADLRSLMSRLDSATTEYKLMVLDKLKDYQADLEQYANQLIKLLSDSSDAVKIKALELIAKMDTHSTEAVSTVSDMLMSPNVTVQKAALATLGSMGGSANVAVPDILNAARSSQKVLMPVAIETLTAINTPQAQQALLSLKSR